MENGFNQNRTHSLSKRVREIEAKHKTMPSTKGPLGKTITDTGAVLERLFLQTLQCVL